MFKGYQDISNQSQFKGFPNLNMQGAVSAYGFSGVSFWLDASYGLNTQTDGAAVSSWVERIQGIPFTQSTAGNQPSYIANDAAFNNYPTINTSTSRFMGSDVRGVNVNLFGTIAFIAKYDSLATGNVLISNSTISSGVFLGGTGNSTGVGWTDNNTTFFQSTIENADAKICIITANDIIVNGANVLNNNSNIIFPSQLMNRIGRLANTSAYLNGKIAELLYWNYRFTSIDAIALSDRINQKYALY